MEMNRGMTREMNRRDFVRRVSLGVFTIYLGGAALPKNAMAIALQDDIKRAKNLDSLTELEKSHVPQLKLPMVAEDGTVVPIEMTLDHPMEPDHYIDSVAFYVPNDPIVGKGEFFYSPANGKPNLKFQTRMDSGTSRVFAVINCTTHGRWAGEAMMRVVGGGC